MSFGSSSSATMVGTLQSAGVCQGQAVWLPNAEAGFLAGVVVTPGSTDGRCTVRTEEGEVEVAASGLLARDVDEKTEFQLEPSVLSVDNLIDLVHLNDGEVLNAVACKREFDEYGCNIGPITVALCKEHSLAGVAPIDKEIRELADAAYDRARQHSCEQFVVLNGASGSGKSQQCVQICAHMSGKARLTNDSELLADKLCAGLKLIDQFGCASTNSSCSSTRFLRLVKLQFGADGVACGAQVVAEALEKSRLVAHPLDETNFSVLYQLCQGVTEKQREALFMRPRMRVEYLYSGSGHNDNLDHEAHAEQYKETCQQLSEFGLSSNEVTTVLQTLAGIIHLGNLKFYHDKDSATNEVRIMNDEDATAAATLLMLDQEEMRHGLTHRVNVTRDGKALGTPLMLHQVTTNRDELAEMIYAGLFDRIVSLVNTKLKPMEDKACFGVTVVDPPGFETLESVLLAPKTSDRELKRRIRKRNKGEEGGMTSKAANRWRRAATTFRAASAAKHACELLGEQNAHREAYRLLQEGGVVNQVSPFAAEGRKLHQEINHNRSGSPVKYGKRKAGGASAATSKVSSRASTRASSAASSPMLRSRSRSHSHGDEAARAALSPISLSAAAAAAIVGEGVEMPADSLLLTDKDLASIPESPYQRRPPIPDTVGVQGDWTRSRSPSQRSFVSPSSSPQLGGVPGPSPPRMEYSGRERGDSVRSRGDSMRSTATDRSRASSMRSVGSNRSRANTVLTIGSDCYSVGSSLATGTTLPVGEHQSPDTEPTAAPTRTASNPNGLTQLLRNYVCDKLQKFSYCNISHKEWEGYVGADCSEPDSSREPCVLSVEACDKPGGLFEQLEGESALTRGTDSRFVTSLVREAPSTKIPKCTTAFQFEHAHGQVKYEAAGFVSANRRPKRIELFELVKAHQELWAAAPQFAHCAANTPVVGVHRDEAEYLEKGLEAGQWTKGASGPARAGLLQEFVDTLVWQLEEASNVSGAHHVALCVRGGACKNTAGTAIHGAGVLQQLRAGGLHLFALTRGVLHVRMDADTFYDRYHMVLDRDADAEVLGRDEANKSVLDAFGVAIPSPAIDHEVIDGQQLGDRVLISNRLYGSLERRREEIIMTRASSQLQSTVRGFMARQMYKQLLEQGYSNQDTRPLALPRDVVQSNLHLINQNQLWAYKIAPWDAFEQFLLQRDKSREKIGWLSSNCEDEEAKDGFADDFQVEIWELNSAQELPLMLAKLWDAVNVCDEVTVEHMRANATKYWVWLGPECELEAIGGAFDREAFIKVMLSVVSFRDEGQRVAKLFLQLDKDDAGLVPEEAVRSYFHAVGGAELGLKEMIHGEANKLLDGILDSTCVGMKRSADRAFDVHSLTTLSHSIRVALDQRVAMAKLARMHSNTIQGLMRSWEEVSVIVGMGTNSQRVIAVLFGALVSRYGNATVDNSMLLDLVLRCHDLKSYMRAARKFHHSQADDAGLLQYQALNRLYGDICLCLDLDSHVVTATGEALENAIQSLGKSQYTLDDFMDLTVGLWRNSELAKIARAMCSVLLPESEKFRAASMLASQMRAQGSPLAARDLEKQIAYESGSERLKHLYETFIVCDIDKSGEVDLKELKRKFAQVAQHIGASKDETEKVVNVLCAATSPGLRHRNAAAARLIEKTDFDGSGSLSFLELVCLVDGCVAAPIPLLADAITASPEAQQMLTVINIGGIDVNKVQSEAATFSPAPQLNFEEAYKVMIKCAERADFRAECECIFVELFGSDDAVVHVSRIWKELPWLLMRLRRSKVTVSRAWVLLEARGLVDQTISKSAFVQLFDMLRQAHRQRVEILQLFEFLDFEGTSNQPSDSRTAQWGQSLRTAGKRDGKLSIHHIQVHVAAVARAVGFIDVTEMEKEWLFAQMKQLYGAEVGWDGFQTLLTMWDEYRMTQSVLIEIFRTLDCYVYGSGHGRVRNPEATRIAQALMCVQVNLEEVIEQLPDILLELGFPKPNQVELEELTLMIFEEEEQHKGGIWESHMISSDDGLIEAETFHRALSRWRNQLRYLSCISEAYSMMDQKGGYLHADNVVSVNDIKENFVLLSEIFGVLATYDMVDNFLAGFPYLDGSEQVPPPVFEDLARKWLTSNRLKKLPEPLVTWRLYEVLTDASTRQLVPADKLQETVFGPAGRTLGLGESGMEECFALIELLEERHREDDRVVLEEFVAVLESWKLTRFTRARSFTTWDAPIHA